MKYEAAFSMVSTLFSSMAGPELRPPKDDEPAAPDIGLVCFDGVWLSPEVHSTVSTVLLLVSKLSLLGVSALSPEVEAPVLLSVGKLASGRSGERFNAPRFTELGRSGVG
jgi:hypothetical protein